MKKTKIAMSLAAVMLTLALASHAGDAPKANPFLTALSTTTQAELPAKSADLVSQADAKQQNQTTVDVVKAAVGLNPAAAAAIVGSIAQTTPAMAAVAAGTAASLVPGQAAVIARAAAAAAPKQAGEIVKAICLMVPSAYSEVAEAVSDVVPGASKEILAAVGEAIPSLKGPINSAWLSGSTTPSVPSVMESLPVAGTSTGLGGGALDGTIQSAGVNPIINPPYVAPPVSPVNLNPNGPGSGQVPVGGQNYANP